MLIEAYIEFENEIPVQAECTGREYSIEIAGHRGVLLTPEFPDDWKGIGLVSPRKGVIEFNSDFQWGSIINYQKRYSSIRACTLWFDDFSEKSYEEVGSSILSDLKRWRSLLIDNISACLQYDFRGSKRIIESRPIGSGQFGIKGEVGGVSTRFSYGDIRESIYLEVHEVLFFDFESFQKVATETSAGKEPLLPFILLFDSDRAYFDGNFRKAILDSATAVEVCFSMVISKALPYSSELNKYVSTKQNSLKLKRELLHALKFKLPYKEKEYVELLDRVRNRVIHAGYYPTRKETSELYSLAKVSIYSLLPNRYEI